MHWILAVATAIVSSTQFAHSANRMKSSKEAGVSRTRGSFSSSRSTSNRGSRAVRKPASQPAQIDISKLRRPRVD